MKKLVWILAGAVLLVAGFYFFQSDNDQNVSETFRSAAVQKGDLKITVAATGKVTPYTEIEAKSKAGGEIVSFPYEEGDNLKKGETAVRLDRETEQSRVNQANADRLIAEAKLEKAKITLKDEELRLKRQKSLFDDKVISRQDLDNVILSAERAKSDVKIAEAELIRARETLKEAEDRLRDTEIKAPLSGTILGKYVEEGQVIASTLSSASEGTLLFTMADLNRIYVEVMVDETDVGRIRPGQKVAITVDAYPDKTFTGGVVRIAPKGRVESTITVFDVTVQVEDEDKTMLKPMMTANAEILIDLREDVLLVPAEAIRKKGDETGVYKPVKGKPVWIPVERGRSNGILTEVRGELQENEEVIVSGVEGGRIKPEGNRNLQRGFRLFRRR